MYNFTNPGVISHNEILDLYKKYIDESFTYKNFSLEEQAKVLAAGRSNNELDATKLVTKCRELGLEIPPIQESIVHVFERMQVNLGLKKNCFVCLIPLDEVAVQRLVINWSFQTASYPVESVEVYLSLLHSKA